MEVRTSICLVELAMCRLPGMRKERGPVTLAVLHVTALGRATRSPRSSGLSDQGEVAGDRVTRRDVVQLGHDVHAGPLGHRTAGAEPAAGGRVQWGRLAA